MAKAYWVSFYRSIASPERLAAYAKLAGPAIAAAGGRFLARGNPAKAYEAGLRERVELIVRRNVLLLTEPRRQGGGDVRFARSFGGDNCQKPDESKQSHHGRPPSVRWPGW